jgi:hypothetical protein
LFKKKSIVIKCNNSKPVSEDQKSINNPYTN